MRLLSYRDRSRATGLQNHVARVRAVAPMARTA
jgi:hypothetical protein